MKVRLATPDDAAAIARIHVDAWRVAYRGMLSDDLLANMDVEFRLSFWKKRLSEVPAPLVFVAVENDVIGFCDLVPSRDADAELTMVGEIAALYVDPQHWRQGVGRALCQAVIETGLGGPYSDMTLWVLRANGPAIQFYQAMGFQVDGAVKKEIARGGGVLEQIRLRQSLVTVSMKFQGVPFPYRGLEPLLMTMIPLAAAWAEEQERTIFREGVPLTPSLLADADCLGVLQPERVRLRMVKEMPFPLNPMLQTAAEESGLISSLTAGLTLRHGIYIREDCWGDRLLVVHELVHTTQYERLGGFRQFLNQYLRECLMPPGYPYGPLEQEAVRRSRELCEGS